MKLVIPLGCFLLFCLSCGSDDESANPTPEVDTVEPKTESPELDGTENELLQLDGAQLVDADKNPIYLQGVAFNNFIWENTSIPPEHHSEIDFQRVKDMGMNTIRFYMNYRTFEEDAEPYTYKQSGWDWLDQNIAWARKYGIYLVLNMHVPQGGYQSQGNGDALWENLENQNRLVALWKAIAERYKDEVRIAGFGPVNEPVPTQSMEQWRTLGQRLIDEVRTVNKNHILFVERAIYVKGSFIPDENLNFPAVTGDNLIFEFHGYDPYFYTHQLLAFAELGDGGAYPDKSIIEVANTEWYTATFDNPTLNPGTTDWTYFEGNRYFVEDENIDVAVPVLIGAEVGGRIYFDDIIVKEYDESGIFVKNILEMNLDTSENWYYWSNNDTGNSGLSTTEGHDDTNSLYIEAATGDSNLSNNRVSFIPQNGYAYEISGWMKGANVSEKSACNIRLDFFKANGKVFTRNKAYLESTINQVVDWAKSKGVPLYMGEFGAGYPCFQDDKGGLQWVADMTDILKRNNIHFSYHSYHEDTFGIYLGSGLPNANNVNQPLINWFTDNLN